MAQEDAQKVNFQLKPAKSVTAFKIFPDLQISEVTVPCIYFCQNNLAPFDMWFQIRDLTMGVSHLPSPQQWGLCWEDCRTRSSSLLPEWGGDCVHLLLQLSLGPWCRMPQPLDPCSSLYINFVPYSGLGAPSRWLMMEHCNTLTACPSRQ